MPFDRSLYPADWEAISLRVKDRAGWKCEWEGCGLEHDLLIVRYESDPERWERPLDCPNYRFKVAHGIVRPVKVVITTSHRCYCDPICGDESHMWALCQLHHLRFDQRQRVIAAAGTRRARDAEAGQGFLIDDIDAESPRKALRSLQERSSASTAEETTS